MFAFGGDPPFDDSDPVSGLDSAFPEVAPVAGPLLVSAEARPTVLKEKWNARPLVPGATGRSDGPPFFVLP